MEIKYTIEILTKDIQDIEKLVGNLQNSPHGSAIELDLAISKLRNVYEILTMIKADRLKQMISPEKIKETERLPKQGSVDEQKPVIITEQEPKPAPKTAPEPAAETAADPAAKPTAETAAETAADPDSKPTVASAPKPVIAKAPEPDPEPGPEPGPATLSESRSKKKSEILAEKFSAESSINENLGGQRGKNVDTNLHGPPIENISRNIGINDRFLIIRELFEGDTDKFNNLVNNLENAGNYQVAAEVLEAQFSNLMEHEGVEILSGLIKRRFTPS